MQNYLNLVNSSPIWVKVIFFVFIAYMAHLIVDFIRKRSTNYFAVQPSKENRKLRSIMTLATSAFIFTIYFLTIGFILREFGVSLTAYLASASVLGLALGYGSQGIVQDIVMGFTFIFSDLVDVGDLVEISGQTGVVKSITLRFVEIENALGAIVFIPNRSVNNVVSYPRGYVRCIVDVTLLGSESEKKAIQVITRDLMKNTSEQFIGILMNEPSEEGRIVMTNKEILRLKFRIWPNRGQPIETTFVKELFYSIKKINPEYEDWMIALSYEVERKNILNSETGQNKDSSVKFKRK